MGSSRRFVRPGRAGGARSVLLVAVVALSTSGCLYSWGRNNYGQLGDGTSGLTAKRLSPGLVGSATDWTAASGSSGGYHSCGIRAGMLWCWGRNDRGQVGDGTTTDRLSRVRIGTANDWSAVSVGGYHTCGLRGSPGTLWCWGWNPYGQVGDGTIDNRSAPVQIGVATDWSLVSAGAYQSCGLRGSPGTLWCWGNNEAGQVGDGSATNRLSPVQIGTDGDWSLVSAGHFNSCGMRAGTLWCWGDNTYGQVGDGTTDQRWSPVQVGSASDWSLVSAGGHHSCGLRAAKLYCWGHNNYGQVGDGTNDNRSSPVRIGGASDWSTVSADQWHTCGVRSPGKLWCWGNNGYGQVGDGTTTHRSSPVRIGGASDWTRADTGGLHSCGLRGTGTLWCWGRNDYGQLGDGTTTDRLKPVQSDAAADWSTVSAGEYHSCGVRGSPGTLWCWGYNNSGQLGDGTSGTDRTSPIQVGVAADWSAVAAGGYHTCGIRAGTLWCWGWNNFGQVGDGTTTNRASPVQVGSATDWSAVTAGGAGTCGIRAGTLWCWGSNDHGEVGDGTHGAWRSSPSQVGGTDWSAVSASGDHTCGIRAGTLWCWGYNGFGQVGDGTSGTDRWSPVQVGVAADWSAVDAGAYFSCGVRGGPGTLWCWGRNTRGQVGDGTYDDRLSPVQAGVATDWTTVSAGEMHTCGVRGSPGTLWCWGDNWTGQVGDGTITVRLSPVQVGSDTYWKTVSAGGDHTLGTRGL